LELEITSMQREHIVAVVALERECQLSSRGEDGYLTLLQDERWLLLIAMQSLQVVGVFMGLMIIDEFQIDNIAVADRYRKKGIATELLSTAIGIAKKKGMVTAILEVRASNSSALKLYERCGFIITGRRKNYYQNPSDDALLMLLNISKHT
jgi:ribosomal-protein-alanine N-acetyltransferase